MRILKFIKKYFFLLWKNSDESLKITFFCFKLFFGYPKEALSIFFYSIESLHSLYFYRKKGFKLTNFEELKNTSAKNSKLFILGSGPSINSITEKEWIDIKENTSWAFNLWFCHKFIPDVYFAQAIPQVEEKKNAYAEGVNNSLVNMLKDKKNLYDKTKFLIRGDAANKNLFYDNIFGEYVKANFKENIGHLAELPIPSYSAILPQNLFKKMHQAGFFDENQHPQCIPKLGSTVGELICLGLILGYKEIVLCGIDMNDGGHFYDDNDYFLKYPYLKEMYKINYSYKDNGHEHMDVSKRPYTIKDIIIALNKFAQENFGANLYVVKESSTLYPKIKKYYF